VLSNLHTNSDKCHLHIQYCSKYRVSGLKVYIHTHARAHTHTHTHTHPHIYEIKYIYIHICFS